MKRYVAMTVDQTKLASALSIDPEGIFDTLDAALQYFYDNGNEGDPPYVATEHPNRPGAWVVHLEGYPWTYEDVMQSIVLEMDDLSGHA